MNKHKSPEVYRLEEVVNENEQKKITCSTDIATEAEEFNPDDEDLSDCVETIIKDRKDERPHLSICSRCESVALVNNRFPYCMDCGWDSLEDQSWGDYE